MLKKKVKKNKKKYYQQKNKFKIKKFIIIWKLMLNHLFH